MSLLHIDIETIRDASTGKEPEGDRLPAAPHHIVVAACAIVLTERQYTPGDGNVRDLWYEATQAVVFGRGSVDERTILEHLAEALERRPNPRLRSWAGDSFDLPVLRAALMAHGIACPWLFSNDVTNRYRDGHRDLMDELCNRGGAVRWSLNGTARRLGLPGKLDVDGGQVKTLWEAGKHEEIQSYCLCDCWQLAAISLRLELSSGVLSVDGYRRSAQSMGELAERTPGLRPIIESERFDRKRFLLEDAAC